jgi:phosphopantetheine--protein transferase-like protein
LLLGVGIDVELVARFASLVPSGNPLPMVFTEVEVAHSAVQGDPAFALCAAFCVKEALFKALGGPIDPLGCQVFACAGGQEPRVEIGPSLRAEIGEATLEVRLFEEGGEVIAAVILRGEGA